MALEIPTYQEIISRVESDIRQKLTENNPSADLDRFTNTIIGIFGTAMAGMIYLVYRLIAFASREVFVSQASAEALVRHGNEIGILRNLATRSSYRFTISGVASTPVPAGTQFVFNLSQIYRTISSGLIQLNGELVTDFESVETGVATNLSVDNELTIQTPILGIDEVAIVSEILIEASNDESVASYRQRNYSAEAGCHFRRITGGVGVMGFGGVRNYTGIFLSSRSGGGNGWCNGRCRRVFASHSDRTKNLRSL